MSNRYNRHDIYIKRIGFSLIRVYRTQVQDVTTSEQDILMSQLKWPIETIFAGVRPKFNQLAASRSGLGVSSGNVNEWRDWHRFTRNVDRVCYDKATSQSALTTGNADPTALTPADFTAADNVQETMTQAGRLVFPEVTKTVTTVRIMAHGINIYADFKAEFFSNYQPFIFGGYNIVTPEDEGALMINFCLYPGTYQPSAHINVSRAREFFFHYSSAFVGVVDSNDPAGAVAIGVLVIVAQTLKFRSLGPVDTKKVSASEHYCNKLKQVYKQLMIMMFATLPNCGNLLKLLIPSHTGDSMQRTRLIAVPKGKKLRDANSMNRIQNGQSAAKQVIKKSMLDFSNNLKVQRLDGSGHLFELFSNMCLRYSLTHVKTCCRIKSHKLPSLQIALIYTFLISVLTKLLMKMSLAWNNGLLSTSCSSQPNPG